MAAQDSKDPLDVLQQMFNDVLIQTGKALRASRKDAPGNNGQAHPVVQFRLPETMRTFHSALDDLETEIVRAKSVMQRDLSRLQANNSVPQPHPQPIEAQTKSPMVIDVESSPQRDGDSQALNLGSENKSVAPFPDMGMDLASLGPLEEGTGVTSQTQPPSRQGDGKSEAQPMATMAPGSSTDQANLGAKTDDTMPSTTGLESQNPEETFTNMEFTLAPTENGGQVDNSNQDQAFDLSAFTTTEVGDDALTLDNILPQNLPEQTSTGPPIGLDMSSNQGATNESSNTLNDQGFDTLNIDTVDFGAADGSDFDFSMGDGNSFDDLMNSHEQNYDTTMEHGQFDADFFGLDKTDGT